MPSKDEPHEMMNIGACINCADIFTHIYSNGLCKSCHDALRNKRHQYSTLRVVTKKDSNIPVNKEGGLDTE